MAKSNYRALEVRNKTREVVNYHRDDEKPGKPLVLMVPGGLVALAALAVISFVAYHAWFVTDLAVESAINYICLLAPIYAGGVFMFSYGYELYDMGKAIRLTAIVVFLTFASVIIIAVLLAALGALGGGKSKSSSSSSSSSDSDSSGGSVLSGIGEVLDGLSSSSSSSSSGQSLSSSYESRSSGSSDLGQFVGGVIGGVMRSDASRAPSEPVERIVTHEVIREVPSEPPKPDPIKCTFCASLYIPEENNYACPNCGASTPADALPPDRQPKPPA